MIIGNSSFSTSNPDPGKCNAGRRIPGITSAKTQRTAVGHRGKVDIPPDLWRKHASSREHVESLNRYLLLDPLTPLSPSGNPWRVIRFVDHAVFPRRHERVNLNTWDSGPQLIRTCSPRGVAYLDTIMRNTGRHTYPTLVVHTTVDRLETLLGLPNKRLSTTQKPN